MKKIFSTSKGRKATVLNRLAKALTIGATSLALSSTLAAPAQAHHRGWHEGGDETTSTSSPTPTATPTSGATGGTWQATANIAFDMRAENQRADIAKVGNNADVIGWQEITTANQQQAILKLKEKGFRTYFPGGRRPDGTLTLAPANSNPISWKRWKWELIDKGTVLTSREIKNVCRDRYASWVILKNKRTGVKISRWNLHFVPGAWNPGTRFQRSQQTELQTAWLAQQAKVTKLIGELQLRSASVIGGGDINNRGEFLGALFAYDLGTNQIDMLTHTLSRRVTPVKTKWLELNSDHDAGLVKYSLN